MAIGDLIPRADDSVLMFSRSTRRLYPGTLPEGGGPVGPQPVIRLGLTSTTSVAAGGYLTIPWTESAGSDPQGYFTLITPTRIQVNFTGHYLLTYNHRWSAITAALSMHSEVRINSADDNVTGTRLFLGQTIPAGAGGAKFGSVAKVIYLVAGDYLNNFAYNTDTAARNLDGAEANTNLQLTALVGAWGIAGPGGTAVPMGAAVQGTISTPIPTNAWTKIPLGGTVYYADSSVFTVDAGDLLCQSAGRYQIVGNVTFQISTTGNARAQVEVRLNGNTATTTPRINAGAAAPTSQAIPPVEATGFFNLVAGDRLSLWGHQQAVASVTMWDCWLSAERVGPGAKGDIGPQGPSGGHIVAEESTDLTARPKLSFLGTRITADDDAAGNRTTVTADSRITRWMGTWTQTYQTNTGYKLGDIVEHAGALWICTADTSLVGVTPVQSGNAFKLLSGKAMGPTTGWVDPENGDLAYDSYVKNKTLMVYDSVQTQWYPASGTHHGGAFAHTLYGTAVNDGTARNLFDYTVKHDLCVLVCMGRLDFTYTQVANSEIRLTVALYQSDGTTISVQPAGSIQRWFGSTNQTAYINYQVQLAATGGQRLIGFMHRASGTGTYTVTLSDYRFNGGSVIEIPYTPLP